MSASGDVGVSPSSFDVSENDRLCRRYEAPTAWTLRLGGPIFLGLAAWTAAQPFPGFQFLVILFTWIGVGVIAIFGAVLSFRPDLKSVEVAPSGFRLNGGSAKVDPVEWASLDKRMVIGDYRSASDARRRVPCILGFGWRAYGLSTDAAAAIVQSELAAGCDVQKFTMPQVPDAFRWKIARPPNKPTPA